MASVVFTVPDSIRERERGFVNEQFTTHTKLSPSSCYFILLTKGPDLRSLTSKAITDFYLIMSCMSSPYNSFLVLRKHISVL